MPPRLPTLLAALALLLASTAAARTCAGLPRLEVKTLPGFCVGVITRDLRFPRGVLPLPGGDVLVAEMGGWERNRGSIARLRRDANGRYTLTRVLTGLDRPHGIILGPDGRVYVGEASRVFRFDPANPAASRQDVIGGTSGVAALPDSGRHPLTALAFDAQRRLIVNVGSASDNCQGPEGPPTGPLCAEAEGTHPRGALRRYVLKWPEGKVSAWGTLARGLRNSMALALHRSGTLLQAENSRDAINLADPRLSDAQYPHDELNVIVSGAHYGWPYCFDMARNSPEFPHYACANTRKPAALLPAHAAPLGMAYYTGPRAPRDLEGRLVVAYHGYRPSGHRVVAFAVSPRGVPQGAPLELIGGWEARADRPQGKPVDVRPGPDGALYLTEDGNGTLLRWSTE
ncbi:glucose/arabinose dehydrogenase [Deinobacterium chartae]|uniref:Glucose/arabinose dehydrogenase n=1 Tax=Deinobacterium chartae TaxID=521158 RepID=A0A841HVP0_9DEIO|nr:PQQ-dependent sugar dehydrogenase [Deinobacterium chartae]MBB6097457.1 glucose/arabinose dehydrogenase [Deinobacterium chartae]